MELKNILKNGTEFKEQVYMLYEEAFPAEEKKPISLMAVSYTHLTLPTKRIV